MASLHPIKITPNVFVHVNQTRTKALQNLDDVGYPGSFRVWMKNGYNVGEEALHNLCIEGFVSSCMYKKNDITLGIWTDCRVECFRKSQNGIKWIGNIS